MSTPNGTTASTSPIIEQEFAAVLGTAEVEKAKLRAQLRMANAHIQQLVEENARLKGAQAIDAAATAVVAEQAKVARAPRKGKIKTA